jgi:hypothetical protein
MSETLRWNLAASRPLSPIRAKRGENAGGFRGEGGRVQKGVAWVSMSDGEEI